MSGNMNNNRALILEGGGMRGVFTAGVLDYFLDNDIRFPYVIGVSAGCTNACSYLSGQRGRSIYAYTTLLEEHPYIGLRPLIKRGELFDMDILYNIFPNQIYPFDMDTFTKDETIFESVTTDAITGEACYLEKPTTFDRLILTLQASGSLPFINRVVDVDGVPMVDGGVADSIPLKRALSHGYKDALVVSTQYRGFRKKVSRHKIPKWIYPKYPKVIEMLKRRASHYNAQIERVERLVMQGKISVIRPSVPLTVGRLTTETKPLRELYTQGYAAAKVWHEIQMQERATKV